MSRLISLKEAAKHDCQYCTNIKRSIGNSREDKSTKYLSGKVCPYNVCPYAEEIDKYDTYEDYLEAQNKIMCELIAKMVFV